MSRNGSGTYNLPAGNPVVTGTTITTTWANTTLNDIASALTGSVAADGQTPMTSSLNMANNKIISVTDPTSAQDAATKNYTDTAITTATSGLSSTYLTKANNLSDVTSASTSRTNLGLGTIATQAASAVAITGGTISGVSLNASDLSSGTVAFARLPTGSVLQVVQASYSTSVSNATSTYADTGLTASITPKFSTSKILVIVSQQVTARGPSDSFNSVGVTVVRGSTTVFTSGAAAATRATENSGTTATGGNASIVYLDSPATTSATAYKTQFNSSNNSTSCQAQDSNGAQGASTITLMEIAG
jgi:hypothetical protein